MLAHLGSGIRTVRRAGQRPGARAEIGGTYVEAAEPAAALAPARRAGARPFVNLLSELRKAERDDRLAVVVLRIRDLDVGWGKAARDPLDPIAGLNAAGRRTVAYLELASFGANLEYYVATRRADDPRGAGRPARPWSAWPRSTCSWAGCGRSSASEIESSSASAGTRPRPDPSPQRGMSEAHREMADALLDSVNEQFVEGIASGARSDAGFRARGRSTPRPSIRTRCSTMGLIDGIAYYDELIEELGRAAPSMRGADYARSTPRASASIPWPSSPWSTAAATW